MSTFQQQETNLFALSAPNDDIHSALMLSASAGQDFGIYTPGYHIEIETTATAIAQTYTETFFEGSDMLDINGHVTPADQVNAQSYIGNSLYYAEEGTTTAIFIVTQGQGTDAQTFCAIDRAPDQNGVTFVTNSALDGYIQNGQAPLEAVNSVVANNPEAVIAWQDVQFNSPYAITLAEAGSDAATSAFTRAQMGFGIHENKSVVILETNGNASTFDPAVEPSGYTFKMEAEQTQTVIDANMGGDAYSAMHTLASGPNHTLMATYSLGENLAERFAQCTSDALNADVNVSSAPSLDGHFVDDISVDHLLGSQCIETNGLNMDGAEVIQIDAMTGAQAVFAHALFLPEENLILAGDYLKVELQDGFFSIDENGNISVSEHGNTYHISKSIRDNDLTNHTISSCAGSDAVIIRDGTIISGGGTYTGASVTTKVKIDLPDVPSLFPNTPGTPYTPGTPSTGCIVDCGTPPVAAVPADHGGPLGIIAAVALVAIAADAFGNKARGTKKIIHKMSNAMGFNNDISPA